MAVFRPDESGAAVAVGPLESKVLDVLWTKGPTFGVPLTSPLSPQRILAGDILFGSQGRPNNLSEKGWLKKERRGKVTFFEVLKSRAEFNLQVMSTVIDSLHRNYGVPVIAKLVDQLAVDEATVEEFERLIAARRAELDNELGDAGRRAA